MSRVRGVFQQPWRHDAVYLYLSVCAPFVALPPVCYPPCLPASSLPLAAPITPKPCSPPTAIGTTLRSILDRAASTLRVAPDGTPHLEPAAASGTGTSGHASVGVLNNLDWFGPMSFLGFLRDVGKYARVGQMLSKDSVRATHTGPHTPPSHRKRRQTKMCCITTWSAADGLSYYTSLCMPLLALNNITIFTALSNKLRVF